MYLVIFNKIVSGNISLSYPTSLLSKITSYFAIDDFFMPKNKNQAL